MKNMSNTCPLLCNLPPILSCMVDLILPPVWNALRQRLSEDAVGRNASRLFKK